MGRIFDPQNKFFRALGSLVDLMGLSLMWLICCLPAVTAGSACAALYHAVLRCVRPGENGAFADFWRTFRAELRSGIPVTLAFIAGAVPLVFLFITFSAWYSEGYMGGLLLGAALGVLCLLPAGMLCIIFPLTARFFFTFRSLFSAALGLTLRHFFRVLLLTAAAAAGAALCIMFWAPVLILPALWAWGATFILEPIFTAYSSEP